MLHGCNTALQCWNNVVTIRNNVATMLQRSVALEIVVCELSHVTSPISNDDGDDVNENDKKATGLD